MFFGLRGFLCDFNSNNLLLIGFIVILHGFFSKTSIFTTFEFILSNRWLVVQVEQLTKVLWVWASVSSGAGVGGRVGACVCLWVWTAPVLRVPCAFFSF